MIDPNKEPEWEWERELQVLQRKHDAEIKEANRTWLIRTIFVIVLWVAIMGAVLFVTRGA